MTRIVHTSDWHLGATLEGLSREEDHQLFLEWLEGALVEHGAEVLVIAGDVFDQAQPSAEAQRHYYGFLRRVAGKVRQVVVVGGNHDSPSRLDAPQEVLSALNVHVVGGVSADRATWERCLCEVDGAGARPACVIAAVPFVHEFRLGVKTALRGEDEIRASFTEAFGGFYRHLADCAEARAHGAPILATGHLAAEGAQRGDAPADIHMIGNIGALSPSIFDQRYCYVALGHVHRSYRVKDSRAWYSGTPVPLGIAEASAPRRVLLFDTDHPSAEPTAIQVPAFRMLTKLRGTVDDVSSAIAALTWETPLAPFVYTEVEVDRYGASVELELIRAVESHPRGGIRLLQPKQVLRGSGAPPTRQAGERLRDLAPEDVFRRLCSARGVEPDEPVLRAFRSLLSSLPEEHS